MITGESLTGSASVRKLQTVLHAKAKEEPGRRFHALVDKVWREDFLLAAWALVRRNGGAAGVDGVTVADVKAYGVERWVGELSRDLKDGTYKPSPVRQVLIPKKQPGKFRPLGIPCLGDRVAQTSAMLVLMPIFEADLEPEQYGYRPGRSAKDAVRRVHRLLHRGRNEVVDADLSNYFGEIPHAELMKSIARRAEDPMPPMPREPHRVPRVSHRLEQSPNGRKPVHWHPAEQGERSEHLPQDQRANGPAVRRMVHR